MEDDDNGKADTSDGKGVAGSREDQQRDIDNFSRDYANGFSGPHAPVNDFTVAAGLTLSSPRASLGDFKVGLSGTVYAGYGPQSGPYGGINANGKVGTSPNNGVSGAAQTNLGGVAASGEEASVKPGFEKNFYGVEFGGFKLGFTGTPETWGVSFGAPIFDDSPVSWSVNFEVPKIDINWGSPFGGPYDPNFEMPNYGPPLVLDLDSDGLDLVALDKSKAMYDIDGDGYLENVGWVGDGDGFLSIDLNGDGLILEPVELAFALSTEDPNDTDLEGLAATYDSNKDGVLDSNDAEFAKFRVWRDIDQDGVCDAGEVKSLADHGITSINLTSDKKEEMIAGNKVYGSTTYTKTDGTTGKVGDVGLATSAAGWKREEVTGGIKFNYEGTGDNAGRALFEAAAATALIMDVAAAGLAGAMGAELNDSLSASGSKDVLLGGGAGMYIHEWKRAA